ncbi:hypothetical protein SIN07_03560 [Pediococcus inopinatus]|uniref:Uncharacterized protein n=1 Tax=Pediococcus inopinatus TaxID=114090 RepID=A0ABZ0Q2E9_9LACO|nr:hypothetical protein [Pediococcus inopinatus]AVL00218.1 hypothetical protein PI20285_06015 [Pediococcus inopinatus]WPC17879.1 hypothetical protein N6G94_02405 [Pediococcus inopinatus]WPC19338.1 hypothetical protein N6G95_08970 [Pediococcus inopinatus]WPC21130.1 hypothetical protein N6G96_07555 [Pediococcus inopinatus]WPP09942.1 hypothetical protein SIN07_03560 [Pediococcus inopinatus]
MLKRNKNGFIFSEALVALGLISISLVLLHNCVQREKQIEKQLEKQVEISRQMLEGSRLFKKNESKKIQVGHSVIEQKPNLFILRNSENIVVRKINFE